MSIFILSAEDESCFWQSPGPSLRIYDMKVNVKLVATENEYIASCPELDVNCYGQNKDEAIRRLKNVLQFYIDSAQELGLDVEYLEELFIEGEKNQKPIATENLPSSKTIN
jgi:predicted RNase H-like HicB family nuclease